MEVTARINIDSPTGRKLVREIEKHKKIAEIEYPLPESIAGQKTFTLEEVFGKLEKKLNEHYGTELKLKY
ncbi:MAG: hypothetical protein Q7U47_01450 [Paludibacter sp.]|nr:hypothetical protein [Paludibacter sp.]